MNSKANLYLALGASLITFTCIWAAYQSPANYPVAIRYQVGSDRDAKTFEFDVLQSQSVTCTFDVYCLGDVILDVNAIGQTIVRGGAIPDPNGTGILKEYSFTWTPSRGLWRVDVIAIDVTGQYRPQIRPRPALSGLPMLDPAYDYTLAMVDPRAYQAAVKVTHRYQYLNSLPLHYGNILELMP